MINPLPCMENGIPLEYRFPLSLIGEDWFSAHCLDRLLTALKKPNPRMLINAAFMDPYDLADHRYSDGVTVDITFDSTSIYALQWDKPYPLLETYDVIYIPCISAVTLSFMRRCVYHRCLVALDGPMFWSQGDQDWSTHNYLTDGYSSVTPTMVAWKPAIAVNHPVHRNGCLVSNQHSTIFV